MIPKELPEVVTHVQDLGNGKYHVFTNTPGDTGTTFACVHDIHYLWHLLEVMGRSEAHQRARMAGESRGRAGETALYDPPPAEERGLEAVTEMTSNELVAQINEQDITQVKVDLFETVENGLEAFAAFPLYPDTAYLRFPVTNYNTAWRDVERNLEPYGVFPIQGKGWR
ncbi:MAG: hypothetical protein U0641_05635 [Anaerolineae bacterium]